MISLAAAGLVGVSSAFAAATTAGESVNSFLSDAPRKATPEYLAEGRTNVAGVAAQLRELLEGNKNAPPPRPYTPIPPDFTVLPGGSGHSTLIYRCRYIKADRNLVVVLENMLQDGAVEAHTEQNLLTIYDLNANIDRLKNALIAIDKPLPQVLVEIKVVEVLFLDGMQRNLSVNFNDSTSVQTGSGKTKELDSTVGTNNNALGTAPAASGLNMNWFPYASGTESLQTAFSWVLNGQDAKILSSPNLVISRNEEASFATGQDIPIQELSTTSSGTNIATSFRRVGVTLNLTPMIINDNLVTLRVAPEVSNIQQYQKITQGYDSTTSQAVTFQVPVISIRSLDTTLTLRDGEVIMMGGLYSNRTSLQEDRTPFLSDMPYLGELFTSKNREQELIQLIFFMKVHILKPDAKPDVILYDPDEVAETSSKIGDILKNSPVFPKLKSTLQQVKEEFIVTPEKRREAEAAAEAPATPAAAAPAAPATAQ